MVRQLLQALALVAFAACSVTAGDGKEPTKDEAVCPNSILEAGEECDDGNPRNGDGCSRDCKIEEREICGNGVLEGDEECDDGNAVDGDGCNRACFDERLLNCGNREMNEGEECDDGNRESGDGCDDECQAEGEACGNRYRSPGGGETTAEECDDGNTDDGDGCSSSCTCEQLENDHANDPESATPFDFDAESTAGIIGCGDNDVWSIQLNDTGLYRFYTEGDVDTLCLIEDDGGRPVSGNDDASREDLNCSVGVSLRGGETYYLKVRHYNEEWGTGPYVLKSEALPPDDHGDEPDDATVIESLPYEQPGRIDWGRDRDVYSLTAPATGTLTMMTEGDIDPMCKLLDDAGELIQDNDDIDTEGREYNCRIDQQLEQGQQVYLVVEPYTSDRQPLGTIGDYRLIVRQQ